MPVNFERLLNGPAIRHFAEPEAIIYKPAPSQPEFTVRGVLDHYQVEVLDPQTSAAVSTKKTVLGVRQSDFPPGYKHRQKDRLKVRGITYDVVNAEPDGQGWVYLELGRIG